MRFPDDPRDRAEESGEESADDAPEGDTGEVVPEDSEAEQRAPVTTGAGARRLFVERILGGATRGEAVFAGEGFVFSCRAFEGDAVSGSLEALSPRRPSGAIWSRNRLIFAHGQARRRGAY